MTMVEEPDRERPQGVTETALWCNACMLPSAVKVPVGAHDPATGRPMGVVDHLFMCVDCGRILDAKGNVIS